MNTRRAGQGGATPHSRFAFALSLLTFFFCLVMYGGITADVPADEFQPRLMHISEFGANRNQDAFKQALYFESTDDGCE